jgi:hypothetical protein
LEEFERRNLRDRRKQATPALSRYVFLGRRKDIRRNDDQRKGGYVDHYSSGLFFFLVLTIGLNILDAFFTLFILGMKGFRELNPVVGSALNLYGDNFWVWKFAIVSLSLILLCLHSKFKRVKAVIVSVSFIYITVVIYQIFWIFRQ